MRKETLNSPGSWSKTPGKSTADSNNDQGNTISPVSSHTISHVMGNSPRPAISISFCAVFAGRVAIIALLRNRPSKMRCFPCPKSCCIPLCSPRQISVLLFRPRHSNHLLMSQRARYFFPLATNRESSLPLFRQPFTQPPPAPVPLWLPPATSS